MTKKDYELITDAIHAARISWEDTEEVAKTFALMLKQENPRFDKKKFIKACLGK